MALIDFANLTQNNLLLERIADALDRAYPLDLAKRVRRVRGPEDIVDISGPAVEERMKLDTFLVKQGLSEAEREEEKQKIAELPDAVRQNLLRNI